MSFGIPMWLLGGGVKVSELYLPWLDIISWPSISCGVIDLRSFDRSKSVKSAPSLGTGLLI